MNCSALRSLLQRLKNILLVLGLAAQLHANAQTFTFHHYGQNEGLRNLDVFALMQDRAGRLWSATENGLFRYDGAEFHRFGIADGIQESMMVAVHQDASGRIWTTSTDYLYYFNGAHFEQVPLNAAPMQLEPGQRLTSLDPQHIVFLNGSALMLAYQAAPIHPGAQQRWEVKPYFDARQIATHPELSQLHSVFAGHGEMWLGCGNAICHVTGNVAGSHITVMAEAQGVPAEAWRLIYRDRHGVLWIRGPNHIRVLTAGSNSFQSRDIAPQAESAFAGAGLLSMVEDHDGNILTQSRDGIARWDGKRWRLFDTSNGVNFSDISTILCDRQGSLWFSTRGHGLHRWLNYGEVENWTKAQGLRDNIVWNILRDSQKRIWIGDQLTVGLLDDGQKQIHPSPDFQSVVFQQPTGIVEAGDGSIWLTNIFGHVLHSDRTGRHFMLRAQVPDTIRMVMDSSHRIWLCTREGLYVIRNPDAQATPEKVDEPSIAGDSFADAAEAPNGDVWFLSDHRLYRLSGGKPGEKWTEIPLDKRLTAGQMRMMAVARDGTLWIGGGLSSLLHLRIDRDRAGDRAQLLASLAPPDIVSSDIQIVRFDHRGWLWVGTDIGVNVFDGVHWKLLTQTDGLISNDTDEGAFFADPDGSIWIGADGGAIHLLHPEHLFSSAPLQIELESATIGDRVLNLAGGNSWRWNNAPLDVSFTSLNYNRQEAILFRYRLVGLEPAWNQTIGHSLHYPPISPGSYRFEVQAVDPNQQTASGIATINFVIRPPWWQARSFHLFLTRILLALGVLAWRWRVRVLLRKQDLLEELVAERTAELQAEKQELIAARETLRQQATHDSLTGVWNRRAILEILDHEISRAEKDGSHLAVVLADLDHFKKVNDTYGHLAGDAILRDAAQRMKESIRSFDYIGRYGGEEFLLVLSGFHAEPPLALLTRLKQTISGRPFVYRDESIFLTASFGVVYIDKPAITPEESVQFADEALYLAKNAGRNRIIFHTHPTQFEGAVQEL